MISPQGLEIGAHGFILYSYALKKIIFKEKDMLKFGFSTREYVLLHEDSGE